MKRSKKEKDKKNQWLKKRQTFGTDKLATSLDKAELKITTCNKNNVRPQRIDYKTRIALQSESIHVCVHITMCGCVL